MCYPRKEGYHYAKGYAVSTMNQRGKSLRTPDRFLVLEFGPYQDHQVLQKRDKPLKKLSGK